MHSTTMRSDDAQEHTRDAQEQPRTIDWSAVATWALGFGLIVYLGLEGGGYDPLVQDRAGIAIWWFLLAAVVVGALPRRRPPPLACVALALFAAFVVWTALSLSWTESAERTSADLARIAGYLGAFGLAVFACGGSNSRRLVAAVAAGIAVIGVVALLSRLHPSWFPASHETARFLASGRERLSYPLNYWNGLAGLIAIGAPLLLQVATSARTIAFRALAAAALPAVALASFLTFSRAGIAAAFIAVAVFLAFVPDRLPKLFTALLAGAGSAVLIVATVHRDALQHALQNDTAHHQGNEVLLLTLVVCLIVGLVQAGFSAALLRGRRPAWTVVSRHRSRLAMVVAALALLVAAVALDAPGRAANGWDEFKGEGGPGKGTERLGSVAGESRYQFWSAAVKENASKPLTGTGSGTFEYWWARNGDVAESVHDTHSLYLQTLGELGIVGLLVLAAFLAAVLLGGGREVVRVGRGRPELAAALAGCTAFCLTAISDWMWQIPVLAVAFLLLAAILVTAGPGPEEPQGGGLRPPLRAAVALVALVAIAAIAIPLASTSLVRESEADVRAGDLPAALSAARSAQNAQPDAASPRLQEALVLESQGSLAAAAVAARAATERESTNWRTWLVLSRMEAELGDASAAVRDYRRARMLNPFSELFQRHEGEE